MPSIADIRKQWGPDYDSLSDSAIVEHLARQNGTDPNVMARVLGVKYQPELGMPPQHTDFSQQAVAVYALAGAVVAFICAMALFKLLGGSVKGATPVATGRRWMNWVVLLHSVGMLTKFFSQLFSGGGRPIDSFAAWLAGAVIFGGAAFGIGALVARIRGTGVGNSVAATSTPPLAANPTMPPETRVAQPVRTLSAELPPNTSTGDSAPVSLAVDEDAIYATIANELETGSTDKGLWTRLFAENDGDENRTKVAYIKLRYERLKPLEQARLAEIEKQRREEAERDWLLAVETMPQEELMTQLTQLGCSISLENNGLLYRVTLPSGKRRVLNNKTSEFRSLLKELRG